MKEPTAADFVSGLTVELHRDDIDLVALLVYRYF